jgi:crotonobetainyl-CoA:carnitine CoA-transferase CaiB-like acyl-CoA transferase
MTVAAPPTARSDANAPLRGIRVLDLTRVLAGPLCTMILADLGADVIKVEAPGSGDEVRLVPPIRNGVSHYFYAVNRNKRSIVVDLKTAEGRELALDLVAKCDVVVENFRPGVLADLGLAYEELAKRRPDVILCSISGFGSTGPLRERPSFDLVTQALTGVMSINGDEDGDPTKLGLPLGDQSGGLMGAIGVLAAIHRRDTTGVGAHIDLSISDSLLSLLGYLAQMYFFTGESPKRVGSGHHNIAPYGSFRCSDGRHLVVALHSGSFFRKFCDLIGRPDLHADERFRTVLSRQQNRRELTRIVSEIIAARSLDDWMERLDGADIPFAPLRTVGEALEDASRADRGLIGTIDDPDLGPMRVVGSPLRSLSGVKVRRAPSLGEHTDEILRDVLGYEPARVEALATKNVIQLAGTPPPTVQHAGRKQTRP